MNEDDAVRSIMTLGVLLGIAIVIINEVLAILPDDGPFTDAADSVEGLISTGFEIAPIILIVIIAAAILTILNKRMGSGGGGGGNGGRFGG